jgi:hypothetical protein
LNKYNSNRLQTPTLNVGVCCLKEFNFAPTMYIQNQTFSDEETLLEQLFDFGLGDSSAEVKAIMKIVDQEVLSNTTFQDYRKTLSDEEDIMELDDEERRIRLAEKLMELYTSFVVEKNQLFGVQAQKQYLLFELDLY